MICLSRSDKNPFKFDEKTKVRTNFNTFNITNGKLYCLGEGEVYELEKLCYSEIINQPCTIENGKIGTRLSHFCTQLQAVQTPMKCAPFNDRIHINQKIAI